MMKFKNNGQNLIFIKLDMIYFKNISDFHDSQLQNYLNTSIEEILLKKNFRIFRLKKTGLT